MRNSWWVVITLVAVALLCSGCRNSGQNTQPLLHPDTGMGPHDIRVKADQVTRVRTASRASEQVVITLYSAFEASHGFSFRLPRARIQPGYRVDDSYDRDHNLRVSAQWNGREYQESTQFPTYVHFVVQSLSAQEAVLEVSARLVERQSGDFIILPVTLLRIQGEDLITLSGPR